MFILFVAVILDSCGSTEDKNSAVAQIPKNSVPDTSYYSGTIDKYPIVMQLIRKGEVVSGNYYYLNNDGLIGLSGNGAGMRLELEEKVGREVTGKFYLNLIKGNGYRGTWKNDKKEFKVNLNRFYIRENISFSYAKKKLLENFYTLELKIGAEKVVTLNDTNVEGGLSIKEIIEEKKENPGVTGSSSSKDSLIWSRNGIINLEHFSSYIGNTEYYNYIYSFVDLQSKKYLKPSDIYTDPEKMKRAVIKKINDIIDEELKTTNKAEWDGNEYPVGSLEANRDKFYDKDLTNVYLTNEGYFFYHDWFYSRMDEPFSPNDYLVFRYKEIRPFINPNGQLNFLLIDPFLNGK